MAWCSSNSYPDFPRNFPIASFATLPRRAFHRVIVGLSTSRLPTDVPPILKDGLESEVKTKLTTIFVGVFIAVVAWVPLWMVEARDPHAMPVGLGLVTFAVSVAGGVIALVGIVRLVIEAARDLKTRS